MSRLRVFADQRLESISRVGTLFSESMTVQIRLAGKCSFNANLHAVIVPCFGGFLTPLLSLALVILSEPNRLKWHK